MENQLIYQFSSASAANRFINVLSFWSVAEVKAKLFGSGNKVRVSYRYNDKGFDPTASELDDLAEQYGGSEVTFGK